MALYPTEQERRELARAEEAEKERLENERIDFINEAIRSLFTLEQATFLYGKYATLKRRVENLERRPRGEPI